MPVDLTEDEIYPHIGANWIDEKYIYDFVEHLVGESENLKITRDPYTGQWKVKGYIPQQKNVLWRVMKGADEKASFTKLLEGALNHHYPTMTSNKVQLKEQMAEARDKIDKISEEFEKWIFADEKRKADLIKTYNEKFNSEVERAYDGSHLELNGLNDEVRKKLYSHQKNAIWRLLQGRNTLLAHCVGAGKTWEMIVGAMEMKRIGMIHKPLFAVPNNTVKQFEEDFRQAYSDANILVLTSDNLKELKTTESTAKETETEKNVRLAKRRRTLSQIATGDWDAIIISHNLFERLPMSFEGMLKYSRDGEKILQAEIIQMTAESTADIKDPQKVINAAMERLKKKYNLDSNEVIMPFEELGIDQIFVDESDLFKNLGFETSNYNPSDPNPENRVVGVSTADAKRSQDLYTKARWLSAQRNGGGLCFSSGTPISNTLNEIFTITRYLNPEYLAENGWTNFDSWANHFGEPKPTIEANSAGEFVQKRRLNLTNLPALIKGFRKFADIKMIEDLPHLLENRPKLKNGKRTVITIEPTDAFNEYKKELLERNEALHKAKTKAERDELNDNHLKIVGDFRKASLDMRLIDPSYTEEEAGGKINAVCDSVFAKFNETTDVKGTQVVFLDLSTPKAKKVKANGEEESDFDAETTAEEVTVYDRIKKGLIQRGIPANQIAFVHDVKKNDLQKLFDKVDEGEIRVIIGSTAKMGAGTNFQKHLVALHHVDCAWRPRDIEQREGRILRVGNLNREVEIFTYVTKGSYDAINWDLISKKQAMIDSLMRGDPTITEIEDISDIAADYKSIAATGDDNPLQKEMRELEEKILRLKSSQNTFLKNQKYAQNRAAILRQKEIPAIERRIKNLQADIKDIKNLNLTGDNFQVKIGDAIYTKFSDAKIAFEKTVNNVKNLSSEKIGEIGGFNINARAEFTQALRDGVLETIGKHVHLTLEKNGSYGVESSLESIRNFIGSNKGTSIFKLLEKEQSKLAKLNAELTGLNEQIKQTFDKQEELDAAEKRLSEVQQQLSEKRFDNENISAENKNVDIQSNVEKNYPDEIKGDKVSEIVYDSLAQDKVIALKVINAIQNALKQTHSAETIQGAIKDSLLSLNVSKKYAEKNSVALVEKIKNEIDLITANTLAELEESFQKITYKEDKDGNKIFYIGRKKATWIDVNNFAKKINKQRATFIFDEFAKTNNVQYADNDDAPEIKTQIIGEKYGFMHNDQNMVESIRKFNSLEDAIKCARYVYQKHSSLLNYYHKKIEVRDKNGNLAFKINTDTVYEGKETAYTDEAKKIVAELDVEKSAEENEIVTPTENATEENSPIQKLADDEKNLSNETENLTDINEVAISKEKLNELFENVNVTDEFSKLQNTKPLFVSNDISQNVQEGQLKKAAIDAFTEKYPEGVEVDTSIGEVKISRRSIRESLAHSIYNAKADAVLSLPEGIKNAAYIGKLQDFEGKGIVNHYFAYPIQYDGEKHYVFCRVREQPFEERRFYIHDIFSDKEITEKSNTLSQTQPPANGQVQLRGVALYRAILTNFFAQGNIDNLKKSAKENPFEGMNFKKLTYKRDRNGRPICYVNGKRVSKYEYLEAGREMISKKSDIIIEKFENATNIKSGEKDSDDAVIIHFPEGISSYKYFSTWEDAIKCARYLYNNFTGIESVGVGNRYSEYFVVGKDGEKVLEDWFKDVLDGTYKKKILEEFGKLSQTGNGSTAIINLVDDRNLTDQQKLLRQFGKTIGANVVFFSNYNKDFHGAYKGNTIYLNVNSARSLTLTFAHELFHFLKANNPKLFSEMAKAAGLTETQLSNYLAETKRTDVKENVDVTEEIIADSMQKILNRVAKKNPNLIQRFFAWLKDTFQKFKDIFQNPKGKLTRGQYAKMADVFGKMATTLTDADGKKIFRYNNRTHNLELANGESLESLLDDTENEGSENQGFFNLDGLSLAGAKFSRTGEDDTAGTFEENDEISQKVFEKYLNEGIMKMVRDTVEKEIGEHVDFSKMNDPVARDKARDSLPSIRKMLIWYNQAEIKNNPAYKNRLATRIEYARRCFDDDERIRTESVRKIDGDSRQGREYRNSAQTLSRNADEQIERSGRRITSGLSRNVGGEVSGARKHFLKLYEEVQNENRRSENKNQGVINLTNAKFSIGSSDNSQSSNDNSSEGLFSKIKNLLTGRPNQQNERFRKHIKTLLEKVAGVKIAAGHMNNGLDIVVKDVEKVIRTNRAYDWQNLLPAVGQKVAAILKLNSTVEMGNYISDWLLTGALNNTSAEAKNFEKALRDNPEIRENLLEIQSAFTKWRNMTPSERIQATIEFERPKPTLGERFKIAKKEGYQQFFEELEPVNDLVKQWEKITGKKLADAVNPYSLLRNYRGIAGRAKLLIEGDESAINALKQIFPNMKWDGFKTIKMILSDIGALENEQIRREFSDFCEAKHVKDMFNKNREIQASIKKVQDRIAELEEMKNQYADAKRIKDLDKRIKQNQEKLKNLEESIYATPYDETTCDAMIKNYSAKYDTAQKDLVKFSNATLTILKNSGVISETTYFNMLRGWKNYVPMHRVFDENEDIKFGDSLKKAQGSSRDTIDPLQSIIRNTYDYIRRAEKNEAKLMLASMARTGGVGMLVEEVDGKQPDDKTTIMFLENGVKKYLQTDVAVVRAVNNMTIPQMDWFIRFLRIGTNLLRNFATVFNPAFAARNLVRDYQDAVIYSKYGFFSPMDFVRGFIHAVKQDDVYAEWMAAGGAQASFWSVDRDYTEASIRNLTKRGLKKYTSLNGFMDLFSRLGEWSELGTRIGYFELKKDLEVPL